MDGSQVDIDGPEPDWSVDHAVEKYLEMAERRCDDEEDRFGAATLDAQTTHLNLICDMQLGGLRLG